MLLVEFFNSPEGDSSAKFTSTTPTTEGQRSSGKDSNSRMVETSAKAVSVTESLYNDAANIAGKFNDLGKLKMSEEDNGVDTITVDVPLMIRLLEYAREDAETDMDLHNVAEQLIALSQSGQTLSMQEYDTIVSSTRN
jgi:hypothetical protein